MASPITAGTGLGSNLPIGDIVTALVNSDKLAKQNQITNQTNLNTSKLSGLGTLKAALAAYQDALTKLGDADNPAFAGFSATSSSPTILTATAGNTAVNGTYNINVVNIATGSKVGSAAFSGGATSAIPTGTLKISQNGTDYTVDIPAGATLQSVSDAINAKLQTKGISSNIITDGNGSRLVLGSTTTGAGSDLSVSGIAGLEISGNTAMTGTGAGYIGLKAVDANFSIDGFAVSSKSNTIDKTVSGLSLTLVAKGDSTVTVGANTDGLKTSLQTFVDAYNKVVTTVNSLTKATADADGNLTVAAAMTGDSLPRSLLASMRNELVTPGPGGKLSVLSQLGIQTAQADGTLSFDATKFTSAMNDKALGGEVQQMFSGTTSDNGLLARMGKSIAPYLETGGILDTRTTSLNVQQKDLSKQQDDLDLRVENLTKTLTAKYNAMDLLVGQLKATASNITSFFDSLNAQKNAS